MVERETSLLYLEAEHEKPSSFPFGHGHVTVYSCRAPDKESVNEDAAGLIAVDEHRAALFVADGCGGMSSGDVASRIAVESLQSRIESCAADGSSLREAIVDGIERANQRVQSLGTGAATTIAAVAINGTTIRPFHVGDSQVLLVGNRGKIKLQTRSHSPVGYALEAGVISEVEAIYHEDRHLVSNVLGSPDTHIEIGPRRTLSPRDTLLIASDGLYDNLHLEEIVDVIRKGPLEGAAAELVKRTRQRMNEVDDGEPSKPDDLTIVMFRLGNG